MAGWLVGKHDGTVPASPPPLHQVRATFDKNPDLMHPSLDPVTYGSGELFWFTVRFNDPVVLVNVTNNKSIAETGTSQVPYRKRLHQKRI